VSHCPDHPQRPAAGGHLGDTGKHGCCSDHACQCAAPVALVAVPRLAVGPAHALRAVPESDIRMAPLRADLLFRPPIA
jgi:hypothetical protein